MRFLRALLTMIVTAGRAASGRLIRRHHEPPDDVVRLGYEPTDVSARGVLGVAILVVVLAVLLQGLLAVFFWIKEAQQSAVKGADRPIPNAARAFPAPRLQPDPRADLLRLRAKEDRQLDTYGWVNRKARRVHLPIDRAMALLVLRGVPGGEPERHLPRNPFERAAVLQASASLSSGSLDFYGR